MKINNIDTRAFSSLTIVDFEHVFFCWTVFRLKLSSMLLLCFLVSWRCRGLFSVLKATSHCQRVVVTTSYILRVENWGGESLDNAVLVSALSLFLISDHLQISFLILIEFRRINLYSPWNHQEVYGSLMISGKKKLINSRKFAWY